MGSQMLLQICPCFETLPTAFHGAGKGVLVIRMDTVMTHQMFLQLEGFRAAAHQAFELPGAAVLQKFVSGQNGLVFECHPTILFVANVEALATIA